MSKKKTKNPIGSSKPCGRVTTFNDTVRTLLIAMAKEGKTDQQMADAMGLQRRTLTLWKSRYPDFKIDLDQAKSIADEFVEAAMFQRACGYSHPAVKIFCTKDGEIITHEYVEHYPPETTACIFWLKNRKGDEWRDRHQVELSEEERNVQKMNDDEINAEIERLEHEQTKRKGT